MIRHGYLRSGLSGPGPWENHRKQKLVLNFYVQSLEGLNRNLKEQTNTYNTKLHVLRMTACNAVFPTLSAGPPDCTAAFPETRREAAGRKSAYQRVFSLQIFLAIQSWARRRAEASAATASATQWWRGRSSLFPFGAVGWHQRGLARVYPLR